MSRDQESGVRSQGTGVGTQYATRNTQHAKHSIIGASPQRIEGREKVTGAATYVDDMQFGPNLLHGMLKRSPIPHGIIKSIDVSKARALPGVRVVVTGQDFPGFTGLSEGSPHLRPGSRALRRRGGGRGGGRHAGDRAAGGRADRGRLRAAAGGL